MPDIIDKVEENNSTQLLAAITKQKQENLVENNVSTAIILKEILNNLHKDIISTIWENETLQQVFMKIKNEVYVPYMKVNRKKETAANLKERLGELFNNYINNMKK
jgi:hypothetical protein